MINTILKLRDENNQVIKEIQEFESFACELNLNDIGFWTLKNCKEALEWPHGVQLFFDDTCVFSGITRKFTNSWDINGEVTQYSGGCENIFLNRRVVLPVPNGPPYPAEFDEISGAAETVIKQFVQKNAGSAAKSTRKVQELSVAADKERGETITEYGRFQSLLELCQNGAVQGRIYFRILDLIFEVYTCQDKSTSVILSKELGTLAKYELTITEPKANYIYAGGKGEGSARLVVENLDSQSIDQFGVCEKFISKSSIEDGTELLSEISGEMEKNSASYSLTVEPQDTEFTQVFRDYWLGDKIRVVLNDGTIVENIISSVKITLDVNGLVIVPVLGLCTQHSFISSIADKFADLEKRISAEERT